LFATTDQSQVFVRGEAQKWGNLIKTAGIELK
jgi:hypothetical protein